MGNPGWEKLLAPILEKYCIKNSFPSEVNPKVVRTIIWRTIANMAKWPEAVEYIASNSSSLMIAALETLKGNKAEAGVVNACAFATYNMAFVEVTIVLIARDSAASKFLRTSFSKDSPRTCRATTS